MVAKAVDSRKRVIRVSKFQPFESRQGVDWVYKLTFDYDGETIDLLKEALQLARRVLGGSNLGGWLGQHKCWFCEPFVWGVVRGRLLGAGYVLDGDPDLVPDAERMRLYDIERRIESPSPVDVQYLLDLVHFQAVLIHDLKEESSRVNP
jgi:hypothetical protein